MSEAYIGALSQVPPELWERGASLHLPASGAARPWLCRDFSRTLLAILPNSRAARDFVADAECVIGAGRAALLPEMPLSFGGEAQAAALRAERGEAIGRWAGGAVRILAATPASLMGQFSSGGGSLPLRAGEGGVSRARLIDWLDEKGYERADIVWSPGQFAFRGGIVDLYDPKDAAPMRIEFFDDEIETMRFFMPDTQRSVRPFASCEIRAISSRRSVTLADMLPADTHVITFEPAEAENSALNYEWLRDGAIARGELSHDGTEPATWNGVLTSLRLFPRLRATARLDGTDAESGITSLPNFRGRRRDAEAYCRSLAEGGASVEAVSDSPAIAEWAARNGFASRGGTISEGFRDAGAGVVMIGDLELSGVALSRGGTAGERAAPSEWGDRLLPDQWVVHEDYGIGRYIGAEQISGPDGPQEYLVLEYAGESRLKIPVMQFHKISKYISYAGAEPEPDSLKGGRWRKASEKAREQAEEAARYLADVYAKREITPGRACAGDPEQEAEFERAFPYRETADQLTAIADVAADMERAVPMDRLLVGDVGFGKTEVAMRAAAKCVFEGRQAAVLAPTTLLAQQHFETWRARFDQFGVRVEVMSRFVTGRRQKKIAADARAGLVDILIGTHRLLGNDVGFKDLGLVIVDEEHRFGVLQKERLKSAYPDVDVLMLSATPIPRSLQLSLSGLRDMSLLKTPPLARRPVITASGPWSEELVRGAVLREKNRGGQIFYVHNRVGGIDREALALRRMFPGLSVATAHGQMDEAELKAAMDKFSGGEVDILVCTTIVESGLDIPRANTLIVSDSQDLGLAQMHQLRGRVGRRDEQAFALFLYPAEIKLSRDASERLEAITSMGDFGAGYELARRDLEIRGGGEFVGKAQHGNLGRVGFQRYCDLLEQAIRRARGDESEPVKIEIGVPSAIPADYLPQDSLRVALYRRLLWIDSPGELDELRAETADRFGPMPRELAFLFGVARVRTRGRELGVASLSVTQGASEITLAPGSPLADSPPPKGWFRKPGGFVSTGGQEPLSRFIEALL